MPEIWAILEHSEANPVESSGELLAELVELARRQQMDAVVCAVLLAAPDAALPDMAFLSSVSVQHLYLLEHPSLAQYSTEGYVSALAWLIQQRAIRAGQDEGQTAPLLVATYATANGRDWAPLLAARLHLPFVPGCLGLDLYDDALFALRSVYDGRVYIQTRTELRGRTAVTTLVPGVRGAPLMSRQRSSPVITRFKPDIAVKDGQERIQRVGIEAPSPEEVELDVAERIVAGGRGIGKEGFRHIADFARFLSAAVGATRVATDRGWVEHARQIGTTGKSVHPKLYIACGISGAAQHTSGMRDSQTVVAINPDRTAPIFSLADLGLLSDANQVLPLAVEMIKQIEP